MTRRSGRHVATAARVLGAVQLPRALGDALATRHMERAAARCDSIRCQAVRWPMRAHDVDGLPINSTRAEISFAFGGSKIPVQWNRGSNEYVADVLADFTKQPERYDLVVSASNAWNKTGSATSCELLRRTITVKEGLGTNSILGGAGGAAVVVICGLVIVVRKRHAHLQAIMVMLFTEVFPASNQRGLSPSDHLVSARCCGVATLTPTQYFKLNS